MKSSLTVLLALCAVVVKPLLVAASPFPLTHPVARSLAIDEDTGEIVSYNASGEEISREKPIHYSAVRRDSGLCSALSTDDAKKCQCIFSYFDSFEVSLMLVLNEVPGWQKLEDTAKANWGSGKWNIATNPEAVCYFFF